MSQTSRLARWHGDNRLGDEVMRTEQVMREVILEYRLKVTGPGIEGEILINGLFTLGRRDIRDNALDG